MNETDRIIDKQLSIPLNNLKNIYENYKQQHSPYSREEIQNSLKNIVINNINNCTLNIKLQNLLREILLINCNLTKENILLSIKNIINQYS